MKEYRYYYSQVPRGFTALSAGAAWLAFIAFAAAVSVPDAGSVADAVVRGLIALAAAAGAAALFRTAWGFDEHECDQQAAALAEAAVPAKSSADGRLRSTAGRAA